MPEDWTEDELDAYWAKLQRTIVFDILNDYDPEFHRSPDAIEHFVPKWEKEIKRRAAAGSKIRDV